MITSNSRYASDALALIEGSDGLHRSTILLPEPTPASFSYVEHVVTGFDRLDVLAQAFLGDASQWWKIAEVNPDVGIDWSVLPVGATIRIPVI